MNKLSDNKFLYLTEIFHSIQGESHTVGYPTVFIRLSGCNLRCSWCDTTYSFKRGVKMPLSEIVDQVNQHQTPHVCITGGEPLLQKNAYPLIKQLIKMNKKISIETSGSILLNELNNAIHIVMDIKCPDSKMSKKNNFDNLAYLKKTDEIKFVIQSEDDYRWAKHIMFKYELNNICNVLFSPEKKTMDPQKLSKWILNDQIQVRLNLQVHTYIWPNQKMGV
ncbi:radical SAM protein [Chlamydiia bacterium]|nr:radical SAM protein [Chlamydiia bacterium]